MDRKTILTIGSIIVLLGILGVARVVQKGKASETIYIRANGLVEGTDKITSADNITYTFTDDISDPIVVQRNNITIDGNQHTLQGNDTGSGFDLVSISNVTIKNMHVENFDFGIFLYLASYCTICENTITNNEFYAVGIRSSSNNTVFENTISNNTNTGISLWDSSHDNCIYGNKITLSSNAGIFIGSNSCCNNISKNQIVNNVDGIHILNSTNNMILGNNITQNSHAGAELTVVSSGNRFVHNNFIDNANQAIANNYSNYWNSSYPSEGNYWSDYNGTDSDYDGIGDTLYFIDANNQDNYPLMGMFNSYNVTYFTPPIVPHVCDVTVISNSTISDFVAPIWIEHPEVIFIRFNVSGAEGSTGFCRVSFPTAMMNGTYHVSVNGTEIPYTLLPCSDANMSYLYFNYTHSTQEVIIIPEFSSFLILPLFMTGTLIGIIAYKRKRESCG